MLFKIDFTRPHLYEDVVTLNQGNLSTNNTLRCRIATGGNDDVTGASIVCTFVINGKQIFESGKVVDGPRGIIDVVFPSEALVVGENTLEFLINRVDGSVAQSPVIKYRVWQGLTTDEGVRADSNYPLLVELINQANSAVNSANEALEGANSVIAQGDELKASVDKLKADCIASVNSFTEENSAKIDNVITQNVAKIDAAIVKNEASIVKADAAAEKAILAANNSDTKTAENIKNVNAAIAAGTQDLEVKAARVDMDGVEHGSLKERLESDLKKGKQISETKEGAYVSFDNTVDSVIPEIELHGNTVQNSSNLADIKSSGIDNGDGTWTYEIVSCGENLLDVSKFTKGYYISVSGGLNPSVDYSVSDYVRVNGMKSLTCSNLAFNANVNAFYDKNKVYISSFTSHNSTVSVPSNACYARVTVLNTDSNYKLQEGTVATPYTPYQETRCDIKLPCQLEKWDKLYFDKEENAWCVDKANIGVILNGKESWIKNAKGYFTVSNFTTSNNILITSNTNSIASDFISERYSVSNFDDIYKGLDKKIAFVCDGGGKGQLAISDSSFSNVEDFKLSLSNNNFKIKCPTTPRKIVLPQSEQIKLNSFANKTHIYTISGEVDATVKATVSKSLASTVQANTNEINILNNKIADIQGLKESQDFAYETDKGYLVCKDTQNGVVKDLKIYGKSLVSRFSKKHTETNITVLYSGVLSTTGFKVEVGKTYTVLGSVKSPTKNMCDVYYQESNAIIGNFKGVPLVFKAIKNETLQFVSLETGLYVLDDVMILEGDYSKNPPKGYFEGMASVGNGNEIEVLSCNENLANVTIVENKVWGTDGILSNSVGSNAISEMISVLPNANFTLSCNGVLASGNIRFFDANKKYISQVFSGKFQTPSNCKFIAWFSTSEKLPKEGKVLLQLGDNLTNYVDSKQDKKTILFKDADNTWKPVLNLRGIDENNCDIVDSGKGKLVKKYNQMNINKNLNIILNDATKTNTIAFAVVVNDAKPGSFSVSNNKCICSKFKNITYGIDEVGFSGTSSNAFVFRINKTDLQTQDVEGCKKWLETNSFDIVYELNEYKECEINPIYPESYVDETMISFGSGVIAPYASWKITSSLPNFVQNIEDRVCRLENDAYKVNLANFAVALNMLDMKARLESLEAPIN